MKAAIAIILALTGCASVGTPIDKAHVAEVERGKTTYSDVVAKFGKPTVVSTSDTGEKIVIYSYAHAQVKGATFIPIVGLFAGGMDTTADTVTFTFDKNDVLLTKSTTAGNMSTHHGTAAPPSH